MPRYFLTKKARVRILKTITLVLMGLGLLSTVETQVLAADEAPEKLPWAFQKLQSPEPPKVIQSRWARNPIDLFILKKLEHKGLKPSVEADRATLLRRLSFDLIGLPPTPSEVEAFQSDHSPGAYERVVDHLLASPQYGERWARHWLDIARFAESQGFEYDHMRENAWPYRDYVIRSFNSDKPYTQFMREQVAGDVIQPVTHDGIVATSLLVCGPWDQAGNSQANQTQRMVTREEEMEDLISVVGQGFLGLTLNCARCHAHKFDPIPQADYYRVKSVFDGVKHGDRPLATPDEEKALKAGSPALPLVYAGKRDQPLPTKRLKRGDVRTPGEEVTPGGLSVIKSPSAEFGLEASSPEGQRRLKFADWLADPTNPLPARVMVNRIWQYHFGIGIIATSNDFGASGVAPTHPELLDWLASRFIASGSSLKELHRLIVSSSTYRQTSDFNQAASRVDAENLYLWRVTPRRLEAEVLRDSMLLVSGELNSKMTGPSFRPFDTTSFNATFYFPTDKLGSEFNRRTIYRMNINSGKDPLLESFDCPDPSVKTPRRGLTTTPLQALGLMNNSFVHRQATLLAARVQKETRGQIRPAIHRAYWHCFARNPSAEELKNAEHLAAETSIENVCWALLNTTEFVYAR